MEAQKELEIVMVDNGASTPYTDVIVDCSGSMGAKMGNSGTRIAFTMNLLKTLQEQGHVNGDTLIHGFCHFYRGCVPMKLLRPGSKMFEVGGGTTPGAALKHVSDVSSTLAIMDMFEDSDLKSSITTPYDCIFYGATV